jgi:NADH-quinone oxidoreductase subunit J
VTAALLAAVGTATARVATTPTIDRVVFAVCAVIVLAGAFGVVLSRNPIYSALSLVLTLFGVAVLFVEQDAQFLAAVQVIVYAGAIVVLFLFVIMLLGVDREENLRRERLPGQRPMAVLVGLAGLGELIALARWRHWVTGVAPAGSHASGGVGNTAALARSIFTTYLLPFELTSLLLVIAVLAAVVLARRPSHPPAAPPPLIETDELGAPLAPQLGGDEEPELPGGVRDVSDEEIGIR